MYAKVFAQILDSSIADDYGLRHFFMDLLVLADENGVVDMTPSSISARTRIPLDSVKSYIEKLELPDLDSRTPDHEGRRIAKLDSHRNWGWVILNYSKFRQIASNEQRKEQTRASMERIRTSTTNAQLVDNQACVKECNYVSISHSSSVSVSASKKRVRNGFVAPSLETVKLHGIKMDLPPEECEKFFHYYESNGWRVGRNPMQMWTSAMANWKRHWIEYGRKTAKTAQSVNPVARLRIIEETISSHPANRESINNRNCTDAEKQEYAKLKSDRDSLRSQIAQGNLQL